MKRMPPKRVPFLQSSSERSPIAFSTLRDLERLTYLYANKIAVCSIRGFATKTDVFFGNYGT